MALFRIGVSADVADLKSLNVWFSTPDLVNPDWSFSPHSRVVKLGDGTLKGQGVGLVKWRWRHLPLEYRYVLRSTFCPYPALSAENIYIETPITDTDSGGVLEWNVYRTIMHWMPAEEDFQVDQHIEFMLTFSHLVLIP